MGCDTQACVSACAFVSTTTMTVEHDVCERLALAHRVGLDVEADLVEQGLPLGQRTAVELGQPVTAYEGDQMVDPIGDVEGQAGAGIADTGQELAARR